MKLKSASLALVALVLMLSGCAGSSNSTACKLYEDAYNQVADAVKAHGDGTVETDYVRAQNDMLPSRLSDAVDRATGDVAVEMRGSLELATASAASPDNEDVGVAYFMSTTEVAAACAKDGAAITLHESE